MTNFGYLERLTIQLTAGAAFLSEEIRERHLRYLIEQQRPDGGWAGREGESDLYYTSFALRSLAIVGELQGAVADRASTFLQNALSSHQSIVDLLSLVYGAQLLRAAGNPDPLDQARTDWSSRLAELLNSLRKADGGFGKTPEGNAGSTYQTFLVIICMELIGQPIDDIDRIANFLLGQQQDDGGFLEVRVAKRSGANPTAAAVGALRALNRLTATIANSAADFLLDLQSGDRGFQANTRIPMADLLSTFTALVTLWDVHRIENARLKQARRYVLSMQRKTGGFGGFELDPSEDVEYTFYGIGALALLQAYR